MLVNFFSKLNILRTFRRFPTFSEDILSQSHFVIGSLISEYPGYSLISDRDSARNCFLMILLFLKSLFLTDSLVGYMLT